MKRAVHLLLFLLCAFTVMLRADTTINGGGNTVSLSSTATLQVLAGKVLTLKNLTLENLSAQRLVMQGEQSKLIIHDSTLLLDGNYSLSHGSMEVRGRCAIEGAYTFTLGVQHLLICAGSQLRIGVDTAFDYHPTGSNRFVIQFEDETGELFLDNATLRNGNGIGMQMTKGALVIDGNSSIESTNTTTDKALVLGSGPDGTGDCLLRIKPGGRLTLSGAGIVYRGRNRSGFDRDGGAGMIDVESGAKFVIERFEASVLDQPVILHGDSGVDIVGTTSLDLNGSVLELQADLSGVTVTGDVVDFLELSGANKNHSVEVLGAAWKPSGDYFAAVGSILNLYEFDGSSLHQLSGIAFPISAQSAAWTKDGQYLALGFAQDASNNEVQVYRFDISETGSIDLLTSATVSTQINSVAFSPDGRFLAAGGFTTDNANVRVYMFDGERLTLLPETLKAHGSVIKSVEWSPCGRFLAVGGESGTGSKRLRVYRFDETLLIEVASAARTLDIDSLRWSPSGKYLAAIGSIEIDIFTFDGKYVELLSSANRGFSANMQGCAWAPDGRHLATVGGQPLEFEALRFNGSTLTSLGGKSHGAPAGFFLNVAHWHPSGDHIGVGGNNGSDGSEIRVYQSLKTQNDPVLDVRDGTISLAKSGEFSLSSLQLKMR